MTGRCGAPDAPAAAGRAASPASRAMPSSSKLKPAKAPVLTAMRASAARRRGREMRPTTTRSRGWRPSAPDAERTGGAVKGMAWFDREWGSGSPVAATTVGLVRAAVHRWRTLMFYALRDRAGPRPHSAGTWVDPAANPAALETRRWQIEVTRVNWTSRVAVRATPRVGTFAFPPSRSSERTSGPGRSGARDHAAILGGRGRCERHALGSRVGRAGVRRAGGLRPGNARAGVPPRDTLAKPRHLVR